MYVHIFMETEYIKSIICWEKILRCLPSMRFILSVPSPARFFLAVNDASFSSENGAIDASFNSSNGVSTELVVCEDFAAGIGQAKVGNIRLPSGTSDINTMQSYSECGGLAECVKPSSSSFFRILQGTARRSPKFFTAGQNRPLSEKSAYFAFIERKINYICLI